MPDPSLDVLRRRVLESALKLADALEEAIAEAPLNQRAGALGVLIDRLLKFEAAHPPTRAAPPADEVIRIEYAWPDGTTGAAPPWASDDPAFEGEVSRGRVRSPFWENRGGEADDPGAGPARG